MWPHVEEVLKLGFGKCNLQVQVPEHGAIQSVEDLVGKRVATSFPNTGGEYFRVDKRVGKERGVVVKTTIEYVGGSVEAACALGLAEGIVDLVGTFPCRRNPFGLAIAFLSLTHVIESGETMRAAGLHPIATVMSTEAILITAKKCVSDDSKASFVPLIQLISSRLVGVIASRKFLLLVYNIHRERLASATLDTAHQR